MIKKAFRKICISSLYRVLPNILCKYSLQVFSAWIRCSIFAQNDLIPEVDMRVSGTAKKMITAGLVFLLAAESAFMVSASSVDQGSDMGKAPADTEVTEESAGLSRTGITDIGAMAPQPTGDGQDKEADRTEPEADTAKTGAADKEAAEGNTAVKAAGEKADTAKTGEAAKDAEEKPDTSRTGEAAKDAGEKADTAKTGEADTASPAASSASTATPAAEAADSQNTAEGSTAVNAAADQAAPSDTDVSTVSPRVKKAEEAYEQFLAGSRTVTYSAENVSISDFSQEDIFEDGKKYTFEEYKAAIQTAETKRHEAVAGGVDIGDSVTAEYAFLEQGPAPLMGLHFGNGDARPFDGGDLYYVLEYDEKSDEISVVFGRDVWSRGYMRINTAGIVTQYGTSSAFEYYFSYYQVAEGGKVSQLYSASYDNRETVLANLNTWDQETYLVMYTIPGYQGSDLPRTEKENSAAVTPVYDSSNIYTLHGFTGGDSTFVVEPESMFDPEDPAYNVYKQKGFTISDNNTVIRAILDRFSSENVSPAMFFAGEAVWTPCK